MVFKYLALATLVASAYIGYEFNSTYVSEGYEKPLVYKAIVLAIKLGNKLGNLAAKFNIGTEASNYRLIFDNLDKLAKVTPDPNVLVQEKMIANVPVRVYRSAASQKKTSLPLMIYYHGGGFVFGSSLPYETFLYRVVKDLDAIVISVEYRLAPESPYPAAVDDCFDVTKYVLDHKNEFDFDVDRVVLAGDSAGGNIVAVTSQRLGEANQSPMPKIQVLIYPWTQLWTTQLPSAQKYNADGIGFSQILAWNLGLTKIDLTKLAQILVSNQNAVLIKDPELRKKIISYIDINKVPEQYRKGREYYNGFSQTFPESIDQDSLLNTDKALAETIAQLASPRVSPLFAESQTLARTPKKAYILALEWDFLKDEGLLYSERLREAGIDVHVEFYYDAPHGTFSVMPDPDKGGFKISKQMHDDLVQYLQKNL